MEEEAWALGSWRAVLARIRDPHPCLTPEWQQAWWACFGAGELAVVALGNGEPSAVAAMTRAPDGVLRFLGDRAVTDCNGPAVVPGQEDAAAAQLLERLRGPSFVGLELVNARPEDGFASSLVRAAGASGLRAHSEPDEPVALLPLPDSWPAYLDGLSRHDRHEIRRKRRNLAGAELRRGDLGSFFALHRASPGEKGDFATPAIERFWRRLEATTATLRVDVLEVDGEAVAMALGFQGPRTFYLYNMAFEQAARDRSPGIVLVAALIERAIADGLDRFDFMRGLERYKLEFGARPSHLMRARIAPR